MMYITQFLKQITLALLIIILGAPVTSFARNRADLSTSYRVQVDQTLNRIPSVSALFSRDEVLVQYANKTQMVRVPTYGRTVANTIRKLQNDPNVQYVEPNYIAYAFAIPNDPYYDPYQWNFDNPTNGGVQAQRAWDSSTGEGVVIAVLDTGVAYENRRESYFRRYYQAPDLEGTTFVQGYDFVNNDPYANDDAGHGTHVAGTIAGTTNNNLGVAGLAYNATLMPVKVLNKNGSGTYADVADGIRYAADNGAQVINLSLGGPVGSRYLKEAIRYAYNKGVTIVAAAGNEGSNIIAYPAAYDDYVIAVGATRFDQTRAPYSNTGSSLDIVAPGGDTRVDQNGDGFKDGILQQTFSRRTNNFGYYLYQGTSMAAPHVSAAAAMLIANNTANTPDEVRTALQSSAVDLGAPGRDDSYGYGLLNIAAALGQTSSPQPTSTPPTATSSPNQAPIADAGSDQTVTDTDNNNTETVFLDGSASSDPDGEIVSYQWYEGDTLLASGVTPSVSLAVGTHTLTLTVTDDQSASSSDSVTVTVEAYTEPPEPPVEPTLLFTDGFEKGLSNWTQDTQRDWKDSRREQSEGRRSAQVDGSAKDAQLISPNRDSSGRVRISFDWFIEKKLDRGEYLAMDVSTDGGNTWAEYRRLRGDQDPEEVWISETLEVDAPSQIRIRFRGNMSSATEDAYVDAVRIEQL